MKLLLLVICSLIATSFAVPTDKEEKLEAVLNEIEVVLQGLQEDKSDVLDVEIEGDLVDMKNVEIEGDLADIKKSPRTFSEDMEEVLLHTDDIVEAEAEVKALGGRPVIQLGHDLLVAKVPSKVAADHAFTQSSTHISSSASAATLRNVRAYHQSREDELKPQPPVKSWTDGTPPMSFPREDSDAAIQGESPYRPTLTGKIAYAVLVVSGPGSLAISNVEYDKILSETMAGTKFWANEAAAAGQDLSFVQWSVKVKIRASNPTSCPTYPSCHDVFANPTLKKLGYSTGKTGRDQLAQYIKSLYDVDGAFIAFFSKYRQAHFAYAFFGGGPSYMQYSNDGWGPDQIDRLFAHEIAHVFNAPDEGRRCDCSRFYGLGTCNDLNRNCGTCTSNQKSCLMYRSDFKLCEHTKKHVGWC